MYGYTPAEIADMTPSQQLMLLVDDANDESVSRVQFSSYEEYAAWRTAQ